MNYRSLKTSLKTSTDSLRRENNTESRRSKPESEFRQIDQVDLQAEPDHDQVDHLDLQPESTLVQDSNRPDNFERYQCLRRSTRSRNTPKYLDDYLTGEDCNIHEIH